MPAFQDKTGQRFGRWVCLEYLGNRRWLCKCDCGTIRDVDSRQLGNGTSKSCGCLQAELMAKMKTTHGLHKSAESQAFRGIIQRCNNPNNCNYHRYGGRGIECRYAKFEEFLADVGPRPKKGFSIDRIDNEGHYEPGNCRWATKHEQDNNRRTSRYITVNGETLSLKQWADRLGIWPSRLRTQAKRLGDDAKAVEYFLKA